MFKLPVLTLHSGRLSDPRALFYFATRSSKDRQAEMKCDQQQSEGHLFRLIRFFCPIVQFIHAADEMMALVSSAVPLLAVAEFFHFLFGLCDQSKALARGYNTVFVFLYLTT